MSPSCLTCLEELRDEEGQAVHTRCARRIFGSATVPAIELDPANLHLFGAQMAGRTTLSGVQRKVSLGWKGKNLRVVAASSAYILKPEGQSFPHLPANEHVSLLIAERFGIEVPPFSLVRLSDGALGLIVRRFDRGQDRRIPMEDFCQLAGLLPKQKYDGSSELCARIVRAFSAEPGVDLLRLFRQFLLSWWIGNGDLHLKNLALLSETPGHPRLSPGFDLLNTYVLLHDPLALSLNGKRDRLRRSDWLAFAAYCDLPKALAARELESPGARLGSAHELLERCFLRADLRQAYGELLGRRAEALSD